jgi:nitrate/nitrite-specific signal transduction histidine kinase
MRHENQADAETTEVVRLRERVAELERQVADLEAGLAMQTSGGEKALLQALADLRGRLEKAERENHEFASMYVEIQEQNEALTNLYVASQRLHATFELGEIKQIISEILAEMVGADEFGLFVLDQRKNELRLISGEGMGKRLPKETLPAGEGIIGDVATTGEPFYFEPKSEAERQAHLPLATLPLSLSGRTVGVVVIYKLLNHKRGFSPIDHQILELVAAHAASALVSARLHSNMDRKLKTIEGFMQLMKSR